MQRAYNQQPGEPRPAADPHIDRMAKDRSLLIVCLNLKPMMAIEAGGAGKAEPHPLAWLIRNDPVADRTVPAARTDTQGAVETHRRPMFAGPNVILVGSESVEQNTGLGQTRLKPTLMDIRHLHAYSSLLSFMLRLIKIYNPLISKFLLLFNSNFN